MAEKKSNREKLNEITASIEQGIKELFQSDKYAEYLRTMSRFHSYSVRNTILIHMQRPDATAVAGFNAWKNKFQRHVKKGEKGITILAPTPFKKKIEEKKLDPVTKAPVLDGNGNVIMEEKEIEIPMFRPVKVFDVSQTDGKPLPQLASPLTGDVQNYEIFMEALRRTSPVPMSFKPIQEAGVDGFLDLDKRDITIQVGMGQMQTVRTFIHEIAHAVLHLKERDMIMAAAGTEQAEKVKPKDHNTKEVEAESVSYAVCQYYGIQTGEYSFGYIAGWSGEKSLPELKASLETISKTANQLINDIDRHFKEICKERGVDLTQPEQAAPEVPDSVERFSADMYDFMDRLYQDGILERKFTPDTKEQFINDIIIELENNSFNEVRSPLEYVIEHTGMDEAKTLLARLGRFEVEERQPERAVPVAEAPAKPTADVLPEQAPEEPPPQVPDQALYLVDDTAYLHIQISDGCFDYTLYDKETMRQLDGGQMAVLDVDSAQPDLRTAADMIILGERDLTGTSVEPVPLEMVDTLRDAADRITQEAAAEIKEQHSDPLEKLREHIAAEDDALWDTVLDKYPVPDPAFSADDMEHLCGYMDGDLLPLSKERAAELLERDMTVYAVQTGENPVMVFDAEEIDEQPANVMFAVPREEWEASQDFRQAVADRMNHQEDRERAFLDHRGDCFAIYQLRHDDSTRDLIYEPLERIRLAGESPRKGNYELVYTGELAAGQDLSVLDKLWEQFNIRHPADYQHPSMSISDIIAVKQDGVVSCHYVDRLGFSALPGFFQPENYLKNAEMAMEDDYGMIDGIINNGPKEPTVAQLEQQARSGQPISLMDLAAATHREEQEKKKSVRQKLKNQPKQEQKRTAPKRSAERDR